MNSLPASASGSTDSLFLAVSCEVAQAVRLSSFYQGLFAPTGLLASGNKKSVGPHELEALERTIEAKYKAHQDSQAPLHLMTFCMNDICISRWRLADSVCNPGGLADPEYRETIFRHAIRMIGSDSTIHSCPLTRGYRWLLRLHIPFPAYVYIVKELRRRPLTPIVERAWDTLATNFEVRGLLNLSPVSPVLHSFRQMTIKAWESQRDNLSASKKTIEPPRLISLFGAVKPLEHEITDMMLGGNGDNVDAPSNSIAPSLQDSSYTSYESLNALNFTDLQFEQFQPWTDMSGWNFTSDDVIMPELMHDQSGSNGVNSFQANMADPIWKWS